MNDERKAFEAWAQPRGYRLQWSEPLATELAGYASTPTHHAWEGWSAARATLPQPAAAQPAVTIYLTRAPNTGEVLRGDEPAAAQGEPVAKVRVHTTGGNAGLAWSAVPLPDAPLLRDGELLYASLPPAVRGLTQREVDAICALRHADDWISHQPHGDNCFVSDHYPGDPGNRCNCGKESALQAVNEALCGYPESMDDDGEPLEVAAASAPSAPAEPAQTQGGETAACEWREEDPDGYTPGTYASACGEMWSFNDGGPEENHVRFCQGCGKPVQIAPFAAAPAPEGVPQNTEGVPASDATEAAYQRGKRAGYSEGFLAGRDGVAPSPEGFGNMDLTPPAPGQKRPAVTIRLTRDPATGEVLRADDPGVSLADADTFAPSHADAPKEPR